MTESPYPEFQVFFVCLLGHMFPWAAELCFGLVSNSCVHVQSYQFEIALINFPSFCDIEIQFPPQSKYHLKIITSSQLKRQLLPGAARPSPPGLITLTGARPVRWDASVKLTFHTWGPSSTVAAAGPPVPSGN